MGMEFSNPVGLAAGFDKSGECIDAFFALGFGFVEIGTVTPRPQKGNPRPRIFRLPQAAALINRMGFNNPGVERVVENIKRSRVPGVVGVNIGKNRDTAIQEAVEDYLACLRNVYRHASYVAVNISSPNTPGLRDLQGGSELDRLLAALKQEQERLAARHGRYVPLAVKIAPDLDADRIDTIARVLLENRIDAVIATNTTISREGIEHHPVSHEAGGVSGAPLRARATAVVAQLSRTLQRRVPVIAVGGIMKASDALEKVVAGAALVQLYTGLIYRGPRLVQEVCSALSQRPRGRIDP
jgi:dihydroorotate dehydrogenase